MVITASTTAESPAASRSVTEDKSQPRNLRQTTLFGMTPKSLPPKKKKNKIYSLFLISKRFPKLELNSISFTEIKPSFFNTTMEAVFLASTLATKSLKDNFYER